MMSKVNVIMLTGHGRWLRVGSVTGIMHSVLNDDTHTWYWREPIVMSMEGNGMNYRATLLNEEGTIVAILFHDSQRDLMNDVNKLYATNTFGMDVRVRMDAVVRTSCNDWIVTDTICDFVLDSSATYV